MRQRTLLIINSLVNTGARVVAIGVRFLLVPFIIGVIGDSNYGLWAVVGQIFAYTHFLDMGLRSAIAREVARRLGSGETDKINRYVNTAGAYYLVATLLILVMVVVVTACYTDWYEVDPEHVWYARAMVLVAGLAVAYAIPHNAYGAVLAGLQRYDIVSGAHVLEDVIRAGLIFALLGRVSIGWGLVLLAVATGGARAIGATLRSVAGIRLCEHVKFQPFRGDRSLLPGMFAFGVNSVIYSMSHTVGSQLALILIGACISPAHAAGFSLAVVLMTAAHSLILTFGISARVVASKYDGEKNEKMLRHLLLRSTRYGNLVTLAGVSVLVMFPSALLHLWMGGRFEGDLNAVAAACQVLAIGHGLFWLLLPGFNVVNGMGRHKFPAAVAVTAAIVSMIAVAILASRQGATLVSVSWGVTVPMIPIWAVVLPIYCCRVTGQPMGRYLWEGFAIPALGCLPAAVAAYLFNRYYGAATWWTLIWQLGCFAALLALSAWFFVLAADDRSQAVRSATGLLRRIRRR